MRKIGAFLEGLKKRRSLMSAYDYVQRVVESKIHCYLACGQEDVKRIVIVGGYVAEEISPMSKEYPNAEFTVFEPSARYFESLRIKYMNDRKVTCVNMAVADKCGQATFYETSLLGSGSLLRLAAAAERDYGARQAESFTVDTTTLDSYFEVSSDSKGSIDLLWCDVQGAELRVLMGGARTLGRCRAVFLEVSLWERQYEGACLMSEVDQILRAAGFDLCCLGTDSLNGTGNALYVHPNRRGNKRQRA